MKIIQITYFLSSGGAEKFVVDLSNELAEMGHDVTICTLHDNGEQQLMFNRQFASQKVKLHSMGFGHGLTLAKVYAVDKYVKSEHPDIVHCHLNVVPYIFHLALINRKIKFFHTLHSIAENTCSIKQRPFNKWFYRRELVRPVCISRLCQESYEQYYGLHNAPYIDNGRAFVSPTDCIEAVRAEVAGYKATAKTCVFIHVARFHEQKNQRLLINTFNRMNAEGEDFTLLIIGKGFDCEAGRALQADACDKIHFLGEKNNVNDYLTCSNAFCLTSIYEGLPISLLEALSCGVTPICTPVGGVPDVIKDSTNGYLSEDLSVEQYMNAVKRFINQPISRDSLKAYYQANYSMTICAEKYEKLYNKF